MKNILITLGVALVVAAAAGGICYRMNCDAGLHRAANEGDAMGWLRAEFKLDDAQFAAVKKLHDDYGVVCGEHCAAIMAAKRRAAPASEIAGLEATCAEAMTAHFRKVATLMARKQGERYLSLVLPRVESYGHEGAPTVRGKF